MYSYRNEMEEENTSAPETVFGGRLLEVVAMEELLLVFLTSNPVNSTSLLF